MLAGLAMMAGLLTATMQTPANAQVAAGGGHARPAGVPANYVVTPFGYFHPSCVTHLAEGDEIRKAERLIRHANGTSSAMLGCGFSHFRADGQEVAGIERNSRTPDISHAYVEYATVTTPKSYGYLAAQWTVPAAPKTNDGQTLYLFPGLEDIDNVVTILQPVLGWNSDYASAWGIASWNCCENGTVYEAKPQPVKSGDTISGYMYNSCPPGTPSCSSWDVVTTDLRTGKSSELLDTSNFDQVFNWAFGAALEVYGIKSCDDYPAINGQPGSNGIAFNNLALYDGNLKEVKEPNWKPAIDTTDTPQCSYAVPKPRQVTLQY